MKILLVDDDSDDRFFFREALQMIDTDILCDTARDGEEALTKLYAVTEKPDIIFMDINMPVLDGNECLKKIQSNEKLRSIPVVMCSTSTNEDEIHRLQSLGASYIGKPSCLALLVHALRKYILPLKERLLRQNTVMINCPEVILPQ